MSASIAPLHSWYASPTFPSSVVSRRTAVVRACADPRSPFRQANGGVTAGRSTKSTSTFLIRIGGNHHTNDHPMSRSRLQTLPLCPCRLDVDGGQLTCAV